MRRAGLLAAVLLAAGCSSGAPHPSSSPPDRTQVTNPAPMSARPLRWSSLATMPTAVSEIGVAVLDGQIHVLGGYVNGRAHSTTHLVYDIAANRWRTAAPLPVPLDHIGTVGLNGLVYAAGGYGTAGRPTATLYAYDPRTDSWSTKAPLPTPRAAGVAVVLDGTLHLVGGKTTGPVGSASVDTGEHDVYDPATDRWTTAAPMPTARDHAAAAVVDGVLHVAAGRPNDLAVHEAYDPGTNTWRTLAPLPLGRSSLAGASLDGRFVVLGGEDGSERTVYREVDAFDPASGRWSRLPDLPQGRQGIGAVVADGRLFLPGGGPTAGPAEQTGTLLVLG